MKRFLTILAAVGALLGLPACDSDLEKVYYDEAFSKPAVLQGIGSSYVLEASQADRPAITFAWQKPQLGFPASVTTDLQMDVAGNDFANPRTLASTKTGDTCSLLTADLNETVLQLMASRPAENGSLAVEFRLVSTISASQPPLYSNRVFTTITPYVE